MCGWRAANILHHENRVILSAKQTDGCSSPGNTEENVAPSPQPQALPLGDDSAAQSCHSEAPRCLGGPAQSSSWGLGRRLNTQHAHYQIYFTCNPSMCIHATEMLTGDADSCLVALGRSQVTPGDTQTPVILWTMKVLHLLAWHVDHHLADLQPCGRGGSFRLAFIITRWWSIKEMKTRGDRMMSEIWIW